MAAKENQYYQGELADRYSQPFRALAHALSAISPPDKAGKRIRKAARLWMKVFRLPFARQRALPNLLLIGASKCGTSSIANHLSSHPDILPPFYKEPRYFDAQRIPKDQLLTYRAHFPTRLRCAIRRLLRGRAPWVADFSPAYYDSPHAARRVRETLGPEVRLLLMLRNPVDRAWSQYRFQHTIGNETEDSFERALAAEEGRLAGEREKQLADEDYFSRPTGLFGYVTRGRYLDHIRHWFEHFDCAQLHVFTLEDFQQDPQRVFDGICDFLDIPHHRIANTVHNVSKKRGSMNPETRQRLLEQFREPNRQLAELLGRDFNWND